jgi:hypothetical protein
MSGVVLGNASLNGLIVAIGWTTRLSSDWIIAAMRII